MTGLTPTLRISWNVQPVSSYGDGLAGAIVLQREVHVGERAIRLVAADDVVARLHLDVARLERARRGVELEALAPQLVHRFGRVGLACWSAGMTQPYVGPFLPFSTARLFLSQ